MSKEFQKKYMHPTRRKLVEMVHNGEYDADITVGYNRSGPEITRNVGDVWEDGDGNLWEQKKGFRVKKGKNTDMFSQIRNEMYEKKQCRMRGKGCDVKGKYGYTDTKLIKKSGYCSGCLSKLEHPIRMDELYVPYQNFKIFSNMVKEAHYMLERLEEAYSQAKQEYEYVNADGKMDKWSMERNVDDLKAEIRTDIENIKAELELVTQKRKEVYELIKDKNYVLVDNLIEDEQNEMG